MHNIFVLDSYAILTTVTILIDSHVHYGVTRSWLILHISIDSI